MYIIEVYNTVHVTTTNKYTKLPQNYQVRVLGLKISVIIYGGINICLRFLIVGIGRNPIE